MKSTRIRRRINAPCPVVYRALLDAASVARWKVPSGNETGWRMALEKLAALVEGRHDP